MIVKLLTEHHLEFLSLKGGYRGSSESSLVKMSNCWKSHATAQMVSWFLDEVVCCPFKKALTPYQISTTDFIHRNIVQFQTSS